MKKIVLLVVLSLICVSVFAAGNQEKTTVTIENINSISRAGVWLFEELPVGLTNTALGSNFISKNTLTVDLTFPNKARGNTFESNKFWQGEGDFYIAIIPIVNNSYQTQNAIMYVGNGNKPIKYSFRNDELVTFSFSEFKSYSYSEFVSNIVINENELASIQGTWKHTNPQAKGATYTFSGNQFTFTVDDGRAPISGTVKISGNKLCLIVSDEQFQIKDIDILPNISIFINEYCIGMGYLDLYWGPFIKQPYGGDLVSDEEELNLIQGTWRSYNRRATYTFSGNQFTVTATDGRAPISGNVKISNDMLYLIVSDELFGLYNYEFRTKNRIYLNELYGHPSSWWGEFIKQ